MPAEKSFGNGGVTMIACPRCDKEMIWQNDYDLGDETEETFTDYLCVCGVMISIPWRDQTEEEKEES
jgi:hypothetical protein